MSVLFEARSVTRIFRSGSGQFIRALHDVTLAVPRGAFAAVTGPSGCGKTTLLSLLGALDRATDGNVLFDGQNLADVSEAERSRVRRRLGLVFQRSPMIRRLAVWENITYPLIPLGSRSAERLKIAERLLERVGIPGRERALAEELSGGERRRAGIARALVAEPEAILADEPTADLDLKSAGAIAALLQSIHAAGTSLIVATHDPALLRLADTTVHLESGTLRIK